MLPCEMKSAVARVERSEEPAFPKRAKRQKQILRCAQDDSSANEGAAIEAASSFSTRVIDSVAQFHHLARQFQLLDHRLGGGAGADRTLAFAG